jgi:hypothetical protein
MDNFVSKIFDRTELRIINPQGSTPGFIFIMSIFRFIKVKDIVEKFVLTDDIFKLKITIANKLLNMKDNELISLNHHSYKYSDLIVHPILIKSILRHIDKIIINKMNIAREIFIIGKQYPFDYITDCSLLSIVKNVKCPNTVHSVKYSCIGILNKNDMFDDEPLTNECIRYFLNLVLIELLPDCLIKIIQSFACTV